MYIMDSAIYEDTPRYDVWLKAIMLLPVFFIIAGVYYLITAEVGAAIGMFALTLLMAATYWAIFPRKYVVLGSKVKIVLGGQFSFNIPFDNLEIARTPKGVSLGINFATTFLSRHAVEIVRKKGVNVNITPSDRELFLENLNKALNDWRRYNLR
ncbi:MAG: hypothetical protein FJ006_12440 [Chloroflexi bacterium]|nr:hypothetical protein [Chloroflexota bacterium]